MNPLKETIACNRRGFAHSLTRQLARLIAVGIGWRWLTKWQLSHMPSIVLKLTEGFGSDGFVYRAQLHHFKDCCILKKMQTHENIERRSVG